MRYSEMKPGWLVEENVYATSKLHEVIGVENSPEAVALDNIGENGCNLTIAVLSMNRSSLTIRLLDSILHKIPDFAGEFLIGDNGSTQEELANLKKALQGCPLKYRIIEFGKNFGVSGGRNRLYREAKTDWIMSLDNDLYFTSNPLKQAQKDIATLGVQFLAMPLVDKGDKNSGIYGAHLYVEPVEGRPAIGIGSTYLVKDIPLDTPYDGFLCTGLPGTSIVNKETFFQVGGFDEGMFVGFEDTEFSVKLFQKGYKVGSCGMISLEHDHPKAENKAAENYEKKRFSNTKLYEAAMHFEKKHGFAVWNKSVAEWVKMRQRETSGSEETTGHDKKFIALVIDRPGWALDHVADQIIENLKDDFAFTRIYVTDIDNVTDVFLVAEECDLIHFLWRGNLALFTHDYAQQRIANLGLTKDEFYDRYIKGKVITTEVYDHLMLDDTDVDKTRWLFQSEDSLLSHYAVSSQKLNKIYNELPNLRLRPKAVLPDGVDLSLFKPQNLERFEHIADRPIRFGWVGNSKWECGDLKGISTIIKPAIEQLQQEGYRVELITSDRNKKMIDHYKMPDYYADIDCYICASLCEGTPNPILEAMACGVPVISTDVGLVPEVLGAKQKEFILQERSVNCMKQVIKKLIENPELFKILSAENMESIKPWDWKIKAKEFKPFFEESLKSTGYKK